MALVGSEQQKHRVRRNTVTVLLSISSVVIALSSCAPIDELQPTDSTPVTTNSVPDTTDVEFRDPSVPVSGGTGLPDSISDSGEEVDCDQAEDLCDSGDWVCDDIADYCDIGPDDGSELPDDWDWDQ